MKNLSPSEVLLSNHQISFIKTGFLDKNSSNGLFEKAKHNNDSMTWDNYNASQDINGQSLIFERNSLHLNKKTLALSTLLYTMKRLDWLLLAVAVSTVAGVYAINFSR